MGEEALLVFKDEDDSAEAASHGQTLLDWLGRRPIDPKKLGGNRTVLFTTGSVCLWYAAYFGLVFNIVLFFEDVLDQGSAQSASSTNNWLGSMFLSSLLGAIVADSQFGPLWACTIFQIITVVGMVLMTSATVFLLSGMSSPGIVAFFYLSMYLTSIGVGAFQPCLQALGADQFDTDAQKAAYFARSFALNNLGTAIADTILVYVTTSKGWVVGFVVCTGLGVGALLLFACGLSIYRQYRYHGNPFMRAVRVIVAAARKWQQQVPTDSKDLFEEGGKYRLILSHSSSLRWLDKAATMLEEEKRSSHGSRKGRDAWRLSTVTEVEELKCVLRLLPVWATTIFQSTIYSQGGTLFVEEGVLMDTSIGSVSMPAATMNMCTLFAMVVMPTIYAATIAPLARRITGLPRGLSSLQRMAAGHLCTILAMAMAAVLEATRLRLAHQGSSAPCIFWQVPQYAMLGVAQFLVSIGMIEFFYFYSPVALRSLGGSLTLTSFACGDYLSSLLVSMVAWVTTLAGQSGWITADLNEGHLDYFFWLLGGVACVNLLCFTGCARAFARQQSAVLA